MSLIAICEIVLRYNIIPLNIVFNEINLITAFDARITHVFKFL